MLPRPHIYRLLTILVIASMLFNLVGPALAQDKSTVYLPVVANSNSATADQATPDSPQSLPVSAAALPAPTNDDILHHGAASTPWTSFAGPGVNALFGNFVWQELDLTVSGRGLGFAFLRTYNSANATSGRLGQGWIDSYNLALTVESATSVVVQMADGRLDRYTLSGGTWIPPTGIFNTLIDNGDSTFALKLKEQTRYNFDANGRLSTIVDRNNNAVTLTYTGSNLTTITDPTGRTFTLAYDVSNHLTSITDPSNRQVTYSYNASGDLNTVTDPRGKVTTYGYDANHRLISLTDANNNTQFALTYDAQGQVTQSTDAENFTTTYTYNLTTGQTTITDPRNNATKVGFDASYRLIGLEDALGFATLATYDANNNVTASTDKRGHTTQYQYDARGNVTQITDAKGGTVQVTYDAQNNPLTIRNQLNRTTTFAYDANGNLLTITDARNSATTFVYDAYGQVTSVTDAEGRVTPLEYDAAGNLKKLTDALNKITNFNYDLLGRMTGVTDPRSATTQLNYDAADHPTEVTDHLGNVTRFAYDDVGNQLSATDARNKTTTYEYDKRNLLVKATDAASGVTRYEYDGNGNLTRVVDPNNHATVTEYDALNRPLRITDAADGVVQYEYDANGNQTRVTDPLGASITFAYDELNRLTSTTTAAINATTTYSYDAASNQTAMTDANGRSTSYAYDELNRLTQVTDALNNNVGYEYDRVGNRTAMINARGQRTTYTYDALNRLTAESDPLGHGASYTYDENGNRTTSTDANGKVTTWVYDQLNRVSQINYPASSGVSAQSVTFEYDAVGNRIRLTDDTGVTQYVYDSLSRLTNLTAPTGQTVGYQYDAAGNRTRITYPDAAVVNFSYDAANRLASVADAGGTTSYTYNARSERTRIDYANGIAGAFLYDAAGRLTDIRYTSPNVGNYLSISYALDKVGSRTQMLDNEGLTRYTYDALYRLTGVTYPDNSAQQFTYDAAGNRQSMIDASGTTNYTYDNGDRLTQMTPPSGSPVTFTWDNNGNMLSRSDGTTYTWDAANRLTKAVITQNGTTDTTEFAYDGDGRRTSKAVNGVVQNYLWDTVSSLPVILNQSAGDQQTDFVYGHELLAMSAGGTRSYYHADGLGSTRSLSAANGQETSGYRYDAFGALRTQTGTSINPFLFTGQQLDGETGLYYLRARYYDPNLGRFLSRDPMGDIEGVYQYASNNPPNRLDPQGTWSIQSLAKSVVNTIKPKVVTVAKAAVKASNNVGNILIDRARLANKVGNVALVVGATTGVASVVPTPASPVLAGIAAFSFSQVVVAKSVSTGLYLGASIAKSAAVLGDYALTGRTPGVEYWDSQKEIGKEVIQGLLLDKIFKVPGRTPTTWMDAPKNKIAAVLKEGVSQIASRVSDIISPPPLGAMPCELPGNPSCDEVYNRSANSNGPNQNIIYGPFLPDTLILCKMSLFLNGTCKIGWVLIGTCKIGGVLFSQSVVRYRHRS